MTDKDIENHIRNMRIPSGLFTVLPLDFRHQHITPHVEVIPEDTLHALGYFFVGGKWILPSFCSIVFDCTKEFPFMTNKDVEHYTDGAITGRMQGTIDSIYIAYFYDENRRTKNDEDQDCYTLYSYGILPRFNEKATGNDKAKVEDYLNGLDFEHHEDLYLCAEINTIVYNIMDHASNTTGGATLTTSTLFYHDTPFGYYTNLSMGGIVFDTTSFEGHDDETRYQNFYDLMYQHLERSNML